MFEAPANTLRAAARSVEEVIRPSLSGAENPLAEEQARLITRHLNFLADRWSDFPALATYELEHRVRLAESILAIIDTKTDAEAILVRSLEDARMQIRAGEAAGRTGDAARRKLLTAVSELVRHLGETQSEMRAQVEATVVEFESELIWVRRSWFMPQGWEPDPTVVPPLRLSQRATI